MKMVMISYSSAINSEIMEVFENCNVESFTKWKQVQGKGKTSGPHFGDEIWPGENSVIFAAIENEKLEHLLKCINDLRMKLGKEGVKAFVWNLEEIT